MLNVLGEAITLTAFKEAAIKEMVAGNFIPDILICGDVVCGKCKLFELCDTRQEFPDVKNFKEIASEFPEYFI